MVRLESEPRQQVHAGVYSLRAQPLPLASTPLTWAELEAAVATGTEDTLIFDALQVLTRIDRHGDLFAPALELRQQLPAGLSS